MKKLKEYLERDISMAILFVFFLGICLLMVVNFGTSMFNATTLSSMAFQLSEVAVLAFGMNSAAYVAEIFRSGIMSIDNGQFEAG